MRHTSSFYQVKPYIINNYDQYGNYNASFSAYNLQAQYNINEIENDHRSTSITSEDSTTHETDSTSCSSDVESFDSTVVNNNENSKIKKVFAIGIPLVSIIMISVIFLVYYFGLMSKNIFK